MTKLFVLGLAICSLSVLAAGEEKVCEFKEGSTAAAVTSFAFEPFGMVSISDPNVAKVFYDAMSEVPEKLMETGVPGDVTMFTRQGQVVCFKQILLSCVTYQCNVPFADLKKGLTRLK